MKKRLSPLLLGFAIVVSACAHNSHAQGAQPSAMPTMLIESRGVTMTLESAVHLIGFRAFIPSAQLAAVAVIPPLGGNDTRASRGLAMEYDSGGDALLLSQWPRSGFQIAVAGNDVTDHPCAPVAYKTDGLIWSTRDGLVMTLQPDGTVPASRISREARRLIAGGACR